MPLFSHFSVVFLIFVWNYFSCVDGNALLMPVSRGVIWTRRHHDPTNYNYMGVNCGGISRFRRNDGQCGLCGDPFDGVRRHEFGGKFATGVIGKTYRPGVKTMKIKVLVNNDQGGYFEFRLCKVDGKRETQACFDKHLMSIVEAVGQGRGQLSRYYVDRVGIVHLTLDIPAGVHCDQCILQWQYTTDNMWGRDSHGRGCLGCGPQETYINCADVRIKGWNLPPTVPTLPPTTPTLPPTTPPSTVPTTMVVTTMPTTTSTTVAPTTAKPVTNPAPKTTVLNKDPGSGSTNGQKKTFTSPSWTQSGNRINFVPQTPLDLHNMNEQKPGTPAPKRNTPFQRRGPPPRPPPSSIPRPPELFPEHIAALNSNAKLHIHTASDRKPYIHLHSELNRGVHVHNTRRATTMPPTRPAPVTNRLQTQPTGFNRNTVGSQPVRAQTNGPSGWNKPVGVTKTRPDGVNQEYGVTEATKKTFIPFQINHSRQPVIRNNPQPQPRNSFNQRQTLDRANQRPSISPQVQKPGVKQERPNMQRNNWKSLATTLAPRKMNLNPQKRPSQQVSKQYTRYDLSQKIGGQPPSSLNSNQRTNNRRLSNSRRFRSRAGLALDPMGEPITTTSTTTVPTTPFSRLDHSKVVPAMGKELKTLYELRNRLKHDSDMNKFRKPVVFERFTRFRVGKGRGPAGPEVPVRSRIGSSPQSPTNDLVKPSQQPAYVQPSVKGTVSSNVNNPHIASLASQSGVQSRNIHGVDFLSQKPLRNEFKHTKHTNTLDKSHLPIEAPAPQGQGHIPIAVVVTGHQQGGHHIPGHSPMNGVLGLYSHNDTAKYGHHKPMVPKTTQRPFYQNQRAPSFRHGVSVNHNIPTGQGGIGANNVMLTDIDPSAYAGVGNAGPSNRRMPMSETDIQRQAGQVFDKTAPPIPVNNFGNIPGHAGHQFGFNAVTQSAPGQSKSQIEAIKAGMLASINKANNHQNVDLSSLQAIQNQLQAQGIITDHAVPNAWQTANLPAQVPSPIQNPVINVVPQHRMASTNAMAGLTQQLQMPLGQRGMPNQVPQNTMPVQSIPNQGNPNMFPNQGFQNLFHVPGTHNMFPNQPRVNNPNPVMQSLFPHQGGNQNMIPDQALYALFQGQAKQGMQPAQILLNNNSPTTTKAVTTPMPQTAPPTPPAGKHAKSNAGAFNIETASARELLIELRKFQELLKTGPLSQIQLQEKQLLQVQLLKKLHEEQMKRAETNDGVQESTTKKVLTTPTTTPTTTTPTTTTPTTTTPTTTTPTTTTTTKPTTTKPTTTTVDPHQKLLEEQQKQIQQLMLQQQRLHQQLEQHKLEQQRQQQLEQQRELQLQQQRLEQQKQKQLEQQRTLELEQQKQRELKQRQLEQERQMQLEKQRQLKLEKERQLKLDLQKQELIKQQQLEKLRRLEQEQAQQQLEQELLLQKQHQQKQKLQMQLEKQLQRQQPLNVLQKSDQIPLLNPLATQQLINTPPQDRQSQSGPATLQQVVEPVIVTHDTISYEQTMTNEVLVPVTSTKETIPDTQPVEPTVQSTSSEPIQTTKPNTQPLKKAADTNKRLDAIVKILAKKMNINIGGTYEGGKVPMLNGLPVSKKAIMKVLRDMALDIIRKSDRTAKSKLVAKKPQTTINTIESTSSVANEPVPSTATLVEDVYNPSTQKQFKQEIVRQPTSIPSAATRLVEEVYNPSTQKQFKQEIVRQPTSIPSAATRLAEEVYNPSTQKQLKQAFVKHPAPSTATGLVEEVYNPATQAQLRQEIVNQPVSSTATRLVEDVYNPSTQTRFQQAIVSEPLGSHDLTERRNNPSTQKQFQQEIVNEPIGAHDLMEHLIEEPTSPITVNNHGGIGNQNMPAPRPTQMLETTQHGQPKQLAIDHFVQTNNNVHSQVQNVNHPSSSHTNARDPYPEMLHDLQTIANMMPELETHQPATEPLIEPRQQEMALVQEPTPRQPINSIQTMTPPTVFQNEQAVNEKTYKIQDSVAGNSNPLNTNGLVDINPLDAGNGADLAGQSSHAAQLGPQQAHQAPRPQTHTQTRPAVKPDRNRKLTQQDISELGNEILKQMKLLIARQRG